MEALALPLVVARKASEGNAKGSDPTRSPTWPAHLGDLMYVAMRQRGWVQEDMARHFKVSQSTIARWLDGSVKPGPRRVEDIAEFCQIDMPTAMRLNFKLGPEATEVSSLAGRVAALEGALSEVTETLARLQARQDVGNELVSQLIEKVKGARETRRPKN